MKTCTRCGEEKSLSEYYKNNSQKSGLQSKCKPCHEKAKVKSRVAAYGLTLEDYRNLFIKQDNKCAICKQDLVLKKHTHIDHCHKTNKVRGLLCHGCNTAIGLFKESQDVLESAREYLKKYS